MTRIRIRGETREICWPPDTEEEWEVVGEYMRAQSELIHKLKRAIVALEKKAHWNMPTQPIMKRRCPWQCEDEEGDPIDPIGGDDEGDGSGAGSEDQSDDLDWT